jgi:hypothetical protein
MRLEYHKSVCLSVRPPNNFLITGQIEKAGELQAKRESLRI